MRHQCDTQLSEDKELMTTDLLKHYLFYEVLGAERFITQDCNMPSTFRLYSFISASNSP